MSTKAKKENLSPSEWKLERIRLELRYAISRYINDKQISVTFFARSLGWSNSKIKNILWGDGNLKLKDIAELLVFLNLEIRITPTDEDIQKFIDDHSKGIDPDIQKAIQDNFWKMV